MPQTMTGRYAGAYQLAMAGLVGPVAGVAGAGSDQSLKSPDSDQYSDHAYSLNAFVSDSGQVLQNPKQAAVGQAPEEWEDARAKRALLAGRANTVGDDAFPRWFQGYDRWLRPKSGKFAPLMLLCGGHGCACGCCGYCGCVCGHGMGETEFLLSETSA